MPLAARPPAAPATVTALRPATGTGDPSHDTVLASEERSPTRSVPVSVVDGSGTVTAVTDRTVPKYWVRARPSVSRAVGDGGGA